MARLALLRELQPNVVRILDSLKIRAVASHTVAGRTSELATDVAVNALPLHMGARKGESSERIVVETCSLPAAACVTDGAIVRETRGDVCRILSRVEFSGVTSEAIRRKSRE
jgi:hypothetical protein